MGTGATSNLTRHIVCKIGGSVIGGVNPTIIEDIKQISSSGAKIVLVHGGGDQVTEIAEKLGKKQKFVSSPEGIKSRYTDKETAEIFTMVMSGLLSKKIVQTLVSNGINAMSLSGVDCSLLVAERKQRLVIIDERGKKGCDRRRLYRKDKQSQYELARVTSRTVYSAGHISGCDRTKQLEPLERRWR